jgi:Ca2+-transporting ATPase
LLLLQLLWINIVTDTIPATALAVDPPEEDIMERPPKRRDDNIFSGGMLPFLIVNSVLMCFIAIWIFLWGMQWGLEKARTLVFTTLVVYQLVLVFNCRSETKSILNTKPFSNKYLVIGVISSMLLQIAVIYVPFLQNVFGTYPLNLMDWLIIGLFAMLSTIISPKFFYKKPKPINTFT